MSYEVQPGTCPKCGESDLEFGTLEAYSEGIAYPFTCNDCGAKGKEWYDITYSETRLDEEDN